MKSQVWSLWTDSSPVVWHLTVITGIYFLIDSRISCGYEEKYNVDYRNTLALLAIC